MAMKTKIIKIELVCTGYHLTIDDYFIDSFKSLNKLLEYLASRIRSDFQ